MHILFYSTASLFESRFLLLLDEATCHHHAGDQVTFVYCDGCLAGCRSNINGSPTVCAVCRHLTRKGCAQLPKSVTVLPLSHFLSTEERAGIADEPFPFGSVRELQEIEFHGADIGYAVLSHYIGMKRNLAPTLTPELTELFKRHLRAAATLTVAAENIVRTCQADCYALFNGRLFDTRGLLRVAMRDPSRTCRCYEIELHHNTWTSRKIYFENSLPHSLPANTARILAAWDAGLKTHSAEALMERGAQFFELRKGNRATIDPIVFTKHQTLGMLPERWSDRERNFVFFNSSEDEFASIDREYDQYKYLPNQADVIRRVATLAQEADPTIHIYLRIHPNLAGVDFEYHRELQRMDQEFKNLTVIPATSPVSTYTLIEQAEKVVVVGSTVGIEAVYAHKPVILLGPALYRLLDVCYLPKDDAELRLLLKDRLAPRNHLAALKYGFYMLSLKGQEWKHFNFSISKRRWRGLRIPYASCYALGGSPALYGLAYKLTTSLLFLPYHLRRSRMRRLGM